MDALEQLETSIIALQLIINKVPSSAAIGVFGFKIKSASAMYCSGSVNCFTASRSKAVFLVSVVQETMVISVSVVQETTI